MKPKEGTILTVARVIAEEAVKQAYAAIDGGCERKEVIVPVELLTAENVGQYGIDGWQ